ncbi:MAG: ATP-binding protein, partial [Chloroflexaceae bacterium]|nr:ATP-binding protein [Chloroflexaceae bacterium]
MYLIQLPFAWGSPRWHPIQWDEYGVLPLPRTRYVLLQTLRTDEQAGFALLAQVARNPFQRWASQSALMAYLHTQPAPLAVLYRISTAPVLGQLSWIPLEKRDWDDLLPIATLLFADLERRIVTGFRPSFSGGSTRLALLLTHRMFDQRRTPLTAAAAMLYDMLDEARGAADNFALAKYEATYSTLHTYAGGREIATSLAWLDACLAARNLDAIAARAMQPPSQTLASPEQPLIRPAVCAALDQLATIAREVSGYQTATSRANRLAALARASDLLQELQQTIDSSVTTPEQYGLQRIVQQWQALVIAVGGDVASQNQRGPVANPYILNNPAESDGFVGREDILRRLEELWGSDANRQVPSVVLYGHRRMGKTSILHNLGTRFGSQTVVVDFNMQRVGTVRDNADLLYQLALALYDACTERGIAGLDEPQEADFPSDSPTRGFNRFLTRLDRVRGSYRFIITVDEFEKLEAQIDAGRLTPDLLDHWRGVYMTYPWLVMAFAGLYTLEERRHDYWNPLFGSVMAVRVSFLTPGATRQLITQPSPDFALDYDEDAIERIIALTGGQPFLVQLIGHSLVTRFNQQTYEAGREGERRFHLADVDAVINAPDFERDGDPYFTGVWRQAEREPAGQTAILAALAPHDGGLDRPALAAATGLPNDVLESALATLVQHDVITPSDTPAPDCYRFT